MMTDDVTIPINVGPVEIARERKAPAPAQRETVFDIRDLEVNYGPTTAISGVNLEIYRNYITAMIGPSGCGKSTFIRCLNRMNDLIPSFSQNGSVRSPGPGLLRPDLGPARQATAASDVDPVAVRRHIGMVFQRPNPFPKSIYDNVAWGLRVLGMKDGLDDRVERALTQAALWDEVKESLKGSALSLPGGQHQRLCIARAIAVEPDVVLMDEPASALAPIATQAIEQLMHELKSQYTFIIVTHNMQQAARVADMTAFFSISRGAEGERWGELIEYDATEKIFTAPSDRRTEDYVTGRFG